MSKTRDEHDIELSPASELPKELRERCLCAMLDLQREIRSSSEWSRGISSELRPAPLSVRYIREIRSAVNQEVITSKSNLASCATWRRYSLSAAAVVIFLLVLLSMLMVPESESVPMETGVRSEFEELLEMESAELIFRMNRADHDPTCEEAPAPPPPPYMEPHPPFRASQQRSIDIPAGNMSDEQPPDGMKDNTSCDCLYWDDIRIESEDDSVIYISVPNRFLLEQSEDVI